MFRTKSTIFDHLVLKDEIYIISKNLVHLGTNPYQGFLGLSQRMATWYTNIFYIDLGTWN